MDILRKETCLDAIKLAHLLEAPKSPPKAHKAYKLVAEDVLEVLRLQGFLTIDSQGWYRSTIGEQLGSGS